MMYLLGNRLRDRWHTGSSWEKITVGGWLLVALLMVIKGITHPGHDTVADEYLVGANRWLAGENLYAGPTGFLYLPAFAFLYSVYQPLSLGAMEVAWRLTQLAVLLWGLVAFARLMAEPDEPSFVPILSLVVISMSVASFRNGQANIILLGLLLLSVVALSQQRWGLATTYLVLGLVCKPTFVVFLLLAVSLHRPLYWRLPLGLLIAFAVPMLGQDPQYVLEQHGHFITMLQQALAYGTAGPKLTWAHFFAIFPQLANVQVPATLQWGVRLIMALLALAAAYYARRRYPPALANYYLYALATCYLMLFNPRNETNDYALLSVAIGFWLAVSRYRYHHLPCQLLCWLFVLSFVNSKFVVRLTPGMWAWWKPVVGTLFTVFLVQRLFSQAPKAPASHTLRTCSESYESVQDKAKSDDKLCLNSFSWPRRGEAKPNKKRSL